MKFIKGFAVSLIALAAAGSASALEFWQSGSPGYLTPGSSIEQGQGVNTSAYNGTAGQFSGVYGGPVVPGGNTPEGFLRWFCVEFQNAGGSTLYNLATPGVWSVGVYENLQRLYSLYYPTAQQVDFYNGGQTSFGLFANDTDAATFQLAVWEIVFDDGLLLNAGTFQGNGNPYSATAQAWLNNLGTSTTYANWTVYKLTNDDQQDFVTARISVPEPGSLALAGLALAGLGFVSRRRS